MGEGESANERMDGADNDGSEECEIKDGKVLMLIKTQT